MLACSWEVEISRSFWSLMQYLLPYSFIALVVYQIPLDLIRICTKRILYNTPYFLEGSFGLPFLDIATLSAGTSTSKFSLSQLFLWQLLLHSPTQVILSKQKEGDRLTVIPITKEALWDTSTEHHWLSSLVLPSVPATSSCTNRDKSLQTKEALNFNVALRLL